MTLKGDVFAPKAPADAIASDVYMVPEDRQAGTIIKDWTVSMIATFPLLLLLLMKVIAWLRFITAYFSRRVTPVMLFGS